MGSWMDKLKGRVKETAGAASGNRKLEAEGKRDTLKGNVKESVEETKQAIKDATDTNRTGRREP